MARIEHREEIDDIERTLGDLSARLASLEQSVQRDLDEAGIPSGAPAFEVRARIRRMREWLSALEKSGHATAMLARARGVVRAWLAQSQSDQAR